MFRRKKKEENNSVLIEHDGDIPAIVFDNKLCVVALGQWLHMLKNIKIIPIGTKVYTRLTPQELLKEISISNDQYETIGKAFARLLMTSNIAKNDIVRVSHFNEEEASFECELVNDNRLLKMHYHYGEIDKEPKLVVIEKKNITLYTLVNFNELVEDSQVVVNEDTGLSYYSHNSLNSYNGKVSKDDQSITIDISYPKHNNNYIEVEFLKHVLLRVNIMDMGINELYDLISCYFNIDYHDFPSIKISRFDKEKLTDRVTIIYGVLELLMMTKNGITVSIDDNDSWSYEKPGIAFSKSPSKGLSYSLSAIEGKIEDINPVKDYEEASKEIEHLKVLVKEMLKK